MTSKRQIINHQQTKFRLTLFCNKSVTIKSWKMRGGMENTGGPDHVLQLDFRHLSIQFSWNHRLISIGRDIQRSSIPTPLSWTGTSFIRSGFSKPSPSWSWIFPIFHDVFTHNIQWLTNFVIKNFFLRSNQNPNLHYFSFLLKFTLCPVTKNPVKNIFFQCSHNPVCIEQLQQDFFSPGWTTSALSAFPQRRGASGLSSNKRCFSDFCGTPWICSKRAISFLC